MHEIFWFLKQFPVPKSLASSEIPLFQRRMHEPVSKVTPRYHGFSKRF